MIHIGDHDGAATVIFIGLHQNTLHMWYGIAPVIQAGQWVGDGGLQLNTNIVAQLAADTFAINQPD